MICLVFKKHVGIISFSQMPAFLSVRFSLPFPGHRFGMTKLD